MVHKPRGELKLKIRWYPECLKRGKRKPMDLRCQVMKNFGVQDKGKHHRTTLLKSSNVRLRDPQSIPLAYILFFTWKLFQNIPQGNK